MKKLLLAAAATAIVAFAAGQASATELFGGTVSYNVAGTSDYIFRGISQTNRNPALSGGVDYSKGMFYAGTWASNVSFAHDYEVDVYAGVKPTLGDFSFDLGAITYYYGTKYSNTTELKAAVSHPIGKGTVGAAYYHNVDYGSTWYYELNGSYPITDKLAISGAVGESDWIGDKYTTGNIGLTYALTPTLSLDGRVSDTNIASTPFTKAADTEFAVTLKAAF